MPADANNCEWNPNTFISTMQTQMALPPDQRDSRYLVADPDYDQPLFNVVALANDLGFCNDGKQLFDIPWSQIGTLSYVLIDDANLNGGDFTNTNILSSKLTNNAASINVKLSNALFQNCDLSGTWLCACTNAIPTHYVDTSMTILNCKAGMGSSVNFQFSGIFSNSTIQFSDVDSALFDCTFKNCQFGIKRSISTAFGSTSFNDCQVTIEESSSIELGLSTFTNSTLTGMISGGCESVSFTGGMIQATLALNATDQNNFCSFTRTTMKGGSLEALVSNAVKSIFQGVDLSSVAFSRAVSTSFPKSILHGTTFTDAASCNFNQAISSAKHPVVFTGHITGNKFKGLKCDTSGANAEPVSYGGSRSTALFAPSSSTGAYAPVSCPLGLTSSSQPCVRFTNNATETDNAGLCASGAGFILPIFYGLAALVVFLVLAYAIKKLSDACKAPTEPQSEESQSLLPQASAGTPEQPHSVNTDTEIGSEERRDERSFNCC